MLCIALSLPATEHKPVHAHTVLRSEDGHHKPGAARECHLAFQQLSTTYKGAQAQLDCVWS
jgi:hypothetical protein